MNRPSPNLSLAACASLCLAGCGGSAADAGARPDVVVAERGPLRVSIRESAELKPLQETRIKSQVEGQATIIYLIPEGSPVKQGDKLAELDVSEVVDRHVNQEITVERARAALVNAEQDLEILEKEISADRSEAESRLKIAQIDLEKFLGRAPTRSRLIDDGSVAAAVDDRDAGQARGHSSNREMLGRLRSDVAGTHYTALPEKVAALLGSEFIDHDTGELAQQIVQQLDEIKLARARLELAEDTLGYSKALHEKDFITKNELDRDQLDCDTKRSQAAQAWNDLDLLISYALEKTHIDLMQKVENAQLGVEKVAASANARRERQRAELEAKRSEYDLAQERLHNYAQQIENAILTAPTDGVVVYAVEGDGRRQQPVEEGLSVRDRQTLMMLPNTTRMVAHLKIQEADIDKVKAGQPAQVKFDAYSQVFTGRVTRVSPLPDSGSRWSNNDLKVYKTEVTLDGENEVGLRPGMSATVEIIVGEIPDVVAVPIVAVKRQGAVHYCWVAGPRGPEARQVSIGVNNLSHVQIVAGVEPGDRVFLARPDGAQTPQFTQPEDVTTAPELDAETAAAMGSASRNDEPAATGDAERARGGPRGGRGAGNEEFLRLVRDRLPQFADRLAEDPMAAFRDQEIRDAIENDPELAAKQAELRNRRGGRNSEAMAEWRKLIAERLPEFAQRIEEDPMATFRDPEIRAAIEADPVLQERMAAMRGRRGGRGGGNGDEGGDGSTGGNGPGRRGGGERGLRNDR